MTLSIGNNVVLCFDFYGRTGEERTYGIAGAIGAGVLSPSFAAVRVLELEAPGEVGNSGFIAVPFSHACCDELELSPLP